MQDSSQVPAPAINSNVGSMVCPQCGSTFSFDKRFVVWCEYCNWNIEPNRKTDEDKGARRRDERAKQKGERLFEAIQDSELARPVLTRNAAALFAIAGIIHTATLAITGFGIYTLATNLRDLYGYLVGIPLILLGLLVRPRLGSLDRDSVVIPADGAPTLYNLVNRIAKELDAKPVEIIVVDANFNASYSHIGLRRRRVLSIGLGLWNAIDDSERIALVGHELGHQVNGDVSRGLVIGSSLRTLEELHAALQVPPTREGTGSLFELIEMLATLVAGAALRLVRLGIRSLYELEESLLFRSQQRAEYFADLLAARIGSSAAMIACLDRIYLARSAALAITYAARREEPDIWASERQFLDRLSAKEHERIRRLEAMAGTAVDSTHPPTNLRIALLKRGPELPAKVTLSPNESQAVAAELVPSFTLIGDRLRERFAS